MKLIKVLIVEDRDEYIEIIKNAISNREIVIAKTVSEAIKALEDNEFDLIVINSWLDEIFLFMTTGQKEKTIVYTRKIGSPTNSAKVALKAVVKNYIGILKLKIKVIQ